MKKYNNKYTNYILLFFILALISLFIFITQYEGFITIGGKRHPDNPPTPNPPTPVVNTDCSNAKPTIVKNCNQYTSSDGYCPCINAKTNGGSNKCTWVVPKDHNGNPVSGLLYGGECQTLY